MPGRVSTLFRLNNPVCRQPPNQPVGKGLIYWTGGTGGMLGIWFVIIVIYPRLQICQK